MFERLTLYLDVAKGFLGWGEPFYISYPKPLARTISKGSIYSMKVGKGRDSPVLVLEDAPKGANELKVRELSLLGYIAYKRNYSNNLLALPWLIILPFRFARRWVRKG